MNGSATATEERPTQTEAPVEEAPHSRSGASRDIGRAVGLISGMVLLSRVLGFLRDALIAATFGKNAITDAYFYAFKLPDTLWMLVAGGAFYAAFVPVITEYFTHGDEEGAWKTYSIVTTFLFTILSIVIPLAWIFARPLIEHFIAPGLTDYVVTERFGVVHPLSMTVEMTRIVLPSQFCFFLGTLMMGMLQAKKRFLMPAVGPVVYNLGIIIGGLTLSRWWGIAGFSWGALGGALVGNLLLQAWAIQGINARFRPSLELSFPGVKRAGKLVLPVIFGVSLPQATDIVNGMFVARVASANSILAYTNRLMQLPLGIFGQAIGIAVLPTLSQQAAQDDMVAFRRTLNYGVRLALFLTVPTSILLIVLAQPLITLVYQRGNFTAADTANATPALVLFCLGVGAWSAQAVVARAFYARNDTWTPVLAGTFVTFFIFVPLNFILTPLMNVPGTPLLTRGPALATTLASLTNTLLLLYFAAKRFGGINGRRIVVSLVRIMVACIPMAAA
ncbi:MAG TPA: murein biosynthesis integral membrane protein MurJ, partial [Armatimonadota bacterium]|nr:murein biosynthesis integral membrane protein MurJ [Armatimonadota bacterium]